MPTITLKAKVLPATTGLQFAGSVGSSPACRVRDHRPHHDIPRRPSRTLDNPRPRRRLGRRPGGQFVSLRWRRRTVILCRRLRGRARSRHVARSSQWRGRRRPPKPSRLLQDGYHAPDHVHCPVVNGPICGQEEIPEVLRRSDSEPCPGRRAFGRRPRWVQCAPIDLLPDFRRHGQLELSKTELALDLTAGVTVHALRPPTR